MRRNSKPVVRPSRTSRCTASMEPPLGGVQLSSISMAPSVPDQDPASQASDSMAAGEEAGAAAAAAGAGAAAGGAGEGDGGAAAGASAMPNTATPLQAM